MTKPLENILYYLKMLDASEILLLLNHLNKYCLECGEEIPNHHHTCCFTHEED